VQLVVLVHNLSLRLSAASHVRERLPNVVPTGRYEGVATCESLFHVFMRKVTQARRAVCEIPATNVEILRQSSRRKQEETRAPWERAAIRVRPTRGETRRRDHPSHAGVTLHEENSMM